MATATSDRFHLAGKRSTKSANKESLGSPWGYVTSITETIATVSLGGSVNGLRVNRTKVQAKNVNLSHEEYQINDELRTMVEREVLS